MTRRPHSGGPRDYNLVREAPPPSSYYLLSKAPSSFAARFATSKQRQQEQHQRGSKDHHRNRTFVSDVRVEVGRDLDGGDNDAFPTTSGRPFMFQDAFDLDLPPTRAAKVSLVTGRDLSGRHHEVLARSESHGARGEEQDLASREVRKSKSFHLPEVHRVPSLTTTRAVASEAAEVARERRKRRSDRAEKKANNR